MKTIDQILLVLTAVVVIYVILKNKNIENLTIEHSGENYGNEEKDYYETENKETIDVEYNLINENEIENDYELI